MEMVKRTQPGFKVLPKRWIVERTFAWVGINRCLSMDFERFAPTSLAFIQKAMISSWQGDWPASAILEPTLKRHEP